MSPCDDAVKLELLKVVSPRIVSNFSFDPASGIELDALDIFVARSETY